MALDLFHPIVAQWFIKTFDKPTEIQEKAWPEIKRQNNTLIAAPTGSGKTLAAFYSAIDDLVKKGINGELVNATQVVYISPLKALSNDIERNLQFPLREIKAELAKAGHEDIDIRVAVRTGDTPQSERTAMIKNPPHIIVTTPESLYNLLTSKNGRIILSTVSTVIVDEIHALVNDKRGSHLSLTLERLDRITPQKLTRIGISATQKPMEQVAAFLTGTPTGLMPDCTIINTGHKRNLELSIELPDSPMSAVMAIEVWEELYAKMINWINQHDTTLIFVNTRSMAERLAHNLTDQLGEGQIMSHHGSMSKEHRYQAEQRLKEGSLKALVATASLELGIDIGSIDLVIQIGSPRAISIFLQRVGRSGHSIHGTPKGFLLPMTRDEMVEGVALLDAIHRGELDAIIMPEKPLDIMAQQIVAEVAASEEMEEDELFNMIKRAYPYRDLTRKEFEETLQMMTEGYATRRGRRGSYVHHDMVNKKIKTRKGARLTALTNGGAIPDNFNYDVILEPAGLFIGTLDEDFSIDSTPGDIFQLGNSSWRIQKIENGKVRVEDAGTLPPTLPFWLGEAPSRTRELSFAVSRLREEVSAILGDMEGIRPIGEDDYDFEESWKKPAVDYLMKEIGVNESVADQTAIYLAMGKLSLGVMPSQNNIVLERFFDDAGDMHLVVHAPFGGRLNRAWGLALRKRFCKKFNFELQAAATENNIVLSLGSTHSFPLDEVFGYLKPQTVRDILIQAMLDSPIFGVRWRWNATRALAIHRRRGGDKVPPQLQRMQSEDLVAQVFPDQLACFENIQGEREVPDHPLVNQTIHDCLTEAMDIDDLEALLGRIVNKEINLYARDLTEPSVLAQEVINARPYAFLDDAGLEERRVRAINNRRWLDPSEAKDLGRLDNAAIKAVQEEAWPQAETEDELHDALVLLGYITAQEGKTGSQDMSWETPFALLRSENRATVLKTPKGKDLWVAVERLPLYQAVYNELICEPELTIPPRLLAKQWDQPTALVEIVRGRLEGSGPITAANIAEDLGLAVGEIDLALIALEQEGFVFRGTFTHNTDDTEWCERRLLQRIHRYTIQTLRKEIQPVSTQDFMRFLFEWQGIGESGREGPEALHAIIDQLEGCEAPAAAWESDIIPARVKDYDFIWLDVLCLSGRVVWGRFRTKQHGTKPGSPIRTTPIMLVNRGNLDTWKKQSAPLNGEMKEIHPNTQKVLDFLKEKGACFFDEIVVKTNLLNSQVEKAISDLVNLGLVTSDSYIGLRSLLVPAKYKSTDGKRARHKQAASFSMEQAGRWSLIEPTTEAETEDRMKELEMMAWKMLKRYGVAFRRLADKEKIMPPWRELVRILRRMEARGEIRGGRFVDGVWGEQFALPDAAPKLRKMRKKERTGHLVAISAADPLNLVGVMVPGAKVTNYMGNRILFRDGEAIATLESGEVTFLKDIPQEEQWQLKNKLIQRTISPKLRAYLGKGIE